jgi:transcriptional regulator with XRE-family HTH domain
MAKPFKTLRDRMSPASHARVKARAEAILAEMPLHELRRARDLSQATIANVLGIQQGSISKIEHQADMYVSTLRDYIEAIGGELKIVASFPTGDVRIQRFDQIPEVPGAVVNQDKERRKSKARR